MGKDVQRLVLPTEISLTFNVVVSFNTYNVSIR